MRSQILMSWAVAGLVAAAAGGCGTMGAGGRSSLDLEVLSGGAVRVGRRVVPVEQLVDRVRAAGATPETEIRLRVPEGMGTGAMRKLVQVLGRGGYTKVIFTRPRRATATVEE